MYYSLEEAKLKLRRRVLSGLPAKEGHVGLSVRASIVFAL